MSKVISKKEAYDILGIPEDSSEDTIKKAFKKLALAYHPDKNNDPDACTKFQRISEAYQTLTNKKIDSPDNIGDFSEIFEIMKMFNIFFRKEKLKTTIELTLEEVYSGSTVEVVYTRAHQTGRTIKTLRHMGPFIAETIEPEITHIEHKTNVVVPPMYKCEQGPIIIELDKNTELDVFVIEKEHPIFKRIGDNLRTVLTVSLKEALTGFERKIFHLNGIEIVLNFSSIVNPYVENGIEKYGFSEKGLLILCFNIEFPKELTNDTKEKLKELLQ
jgi:DnaJ-class molecular chaperone